METGLRSGTHDVQKEMQYWWYAGRFWTMLGQALTVLVVMAICSTYKSSLDWKPRHIVDGCGPHVTYLSGKSLSGDLSWAQDPDISSMTIENRAKYAMLVPPTRNIGMVTNGSLALSAASIFDENGRWASVEDKEDLSIEQCLMYIRGEQE